MGRDHHRAARRRLGGNLIDNQQGGGNRALFRLAELYAHFAGLAQLDRLALVMRTATGEIAPVNRRTLAELRTGLQVVANLQRHGRARHSSG